MTAKKLAEILLQTPDLEVMVDGYEGGVDTPAKITEETIRLNYHDYNYYGKHEIINEKDIEIDKKYSDKKYKYKKVIVISRSSL